MSKAATYYVLLVGHSPTRAVVHIVPSLAPRVPCMGRLMTAAGPFPTLIRALHAQQRMAEEWRCDGAPPDRDAFVAQHWGWTGP